MKKRADPHAYLDRPVSSYLGAAKASVKKELARLMAYAAARLLTPGALENPETRARFWRKGIAVQPKGFYSSMVDPSDLRRTNSPDSSYPGLDLNRDGQLRYLTDVFPRYLSEYAAILVERPDDWDRQARFYLANDAFQNVDALAYWGMVRSSRPQRILEIGSGFSTLLAAEALARNGAGQLTVIDPFPREFVRRSDCRVELITEAAEDTAPQLVASLAKDDIVFVDSSHVVRQGGDVSWFFLKILPRLADGVIVHIHDVHFPFDYPLEIIEDRNTYWTEQYLLHAYLTKNACDEVLFSSRYSTQVLPAETRAAFPGVRKLDGSSFWMRVHDAAG